MKKEKRRARDNIHIVTETKNVDEYYSRAREKDLIAQILLIT